jgi:hypothetical protein
MNKIRRTTFVVPVLVVLGIAATVQPVSASVEAECRQEAKDYGVMPELDVKSVVELTQIFDEVQNHNAMPILNDALV